MTLTIRAETSTMTYSSRNLEAASEALSSVPQTESDAGSAAQPADVPADPGISADVALHAQRITDSRRRLNERVSMQQMATGTVAQFSAYMDAIRTQVQRTTGHVATNVDRLGLDSAMKGMTAELDRVVANLTDDTRQPDDAATQDTGWATELMQLARTSILDNARLALRAQANTPSSWTLSLLRG